jgi:ribose-phosphate pyrophosphokinase
VANFLETAGADRLLTVDLHAGQIQGFFNIPVDELTALYILSRYFKDKGIPNLTAVATDVGDARRARNVADRLDVPLAIVEKRRIGNEQRSEAVNIIGEVKGMNALIVDDEVDTDRHDPPAGREASAQDHRFVFGTPARGSHTAHPHRPLGGRAVPVRVRHAQVAQGHHH